MISVTQNNKQYVIHKNTTSAETNPQSVLERSSTRSYHFYRFSLGDSLEDNSSDFQNNDNNLNYSENSNNDFGYGNLNIPIGDKPDLSLDPNDIEDILKLLTAPDFDEAPFVELKIWTLEHFIIRTGLTVQDALNLRLADLDIPNQVCYVSSSAESRLPIYLHSALEAIMEPYLKRRGGSETDFLFCDEYGNQLSEELCYEQALRYNYKRGVSSIQLNQLRYLYI